MKDWKDNADIASVGLEMGGCVAVGYFLGSWFDGQFGSEPWGMALFLFCGFGAAFKGLLRVAKRARRVAEQDQDGATVSRPLAAGSFGMGDR